MLRNYFKIALRNLFKHKLHTAINMLSLSIGISCAIVILIYINEEITFDTFHSKSDKIYRVWMEEHYDGGQDIYNSVTPLILEQELAASFPEIDAITQFHQNNTLVKLQANSFSEQMTLVSPGFFKIFDFPVVYGSTVSVFEDRNDLVLSKVHARKYFGERDPIGEVLDLQVGDTFVPMTVKAVLEVPSNSSHQFDLLVSNLNNDRFFREGALRSWYNVVTDTYLLTETPGQELENKLPDMVKQALGEDYEEGAYVFHLQPLEDIHLNTDIPLGNVPVSDPQYAYILGFISLFIILLGGINFITLSIGRSIYRAKEVGVRKVSGAVKPQLTMQFLSESLLIAVIAGLMALVIAYIMIPVFNELADRQLEMTFTPWLAVVFFMLILIIGFGAGFYPALVLASFKPVTILKGNVTVGRGKQTFRKGMVIVQFVISIFLLTTTLLMQRQLNFIRERNLGYDSESVLMVTIDAPFKGGLFETLQHAEKSASVYKQEVLKDPNVLSAGIAYQRFGDTNWIEVGFKDQAGNFRDMNHIIVDSDLFETMGLEMVQGRAFDYSKSSDKNTAIIVNEAAVAYFGWENPLEAQFDGKRFSTHQIIGVVKDFNYQSLHGEIKPLAITINPQLILRSVEDIGFYFPVTPYLHLKVNQANLASVIESLESNWDRVFPNQPFQVDFLDQRLWKQYEREISLGKIVTYSSILAILIGALGLFGLVTLAVNTRVKEIGIRKVLGASLGSLFYILSKDYIAIIVIALVISIPLSVYFINNWLSDFQYRIGIPMDVFVIAGLIVILISLVTVSYNILKASRTPAVDSLKYE